MKSLILLFFISSSSLYAEDLTGDKRLEELEQLTAEMNEQFYEVVEDNENSIENERMPASVDEEGQNP